ncbi:hypothetical protein [Oceanobacillus kimchii]|uniref:hypothetical protein n=1 Tax=Oceanobacillus kimchii TaxID=746691 RepID=UPI00232B4E48|nr:hypothetical protein [Oceanobacillus kimchii]
MNFKKINFYSYIILLVSIEIIVILGYFSIVIGWSDTLIAGIIAFIGAVLGGGVTYLGVRITLKHRDKELFLQNASERLAALEYLNSIYGKELNEVSLIEKNYLENGFNEHYVRVYVQEFKQILSDQRNLMYKNLTFEENEILDLYIKSIDSLSKRRTLREEDVTDVIDKVRLVFEVIYRSRDTLRKNYYKYKKERRF